MDITFLEYGTDSSFQDLSIGAILAVLEHVELGVLELVALGRKGKSFDFQGDSITVLTWALTDT